MRVRRIVLLGVVAAVGLGGATFVPRVGAAPRRAAAPAAGPLAGAGRADRVGQGTLTASLQRRIGDRRTAGSYLDAGGGVVVTVLDAAAAAQVSAAGATPRLVSRSWAQLTAAQDALTRTGPVPGTSIGIDPRANQVVLTLTDDVPASAAAALQAAATRLGDAVRVERSDGSLAITGRAGSTIASNGNSNVCTAGFNVRDNISGDLEMVTAGHCTAAATEPWKDFAGREIGVSTFSRFPDNDFGLILYTEGDPEPDQTGFIYTDASAGITQDITGAADPVDGEPVCTTGFGSGPRCGTVLRVNVSVTYRSGDQVRGLIETDMCVASGDSGGPLFDGSIGLGIASGGGCGTNPRSYYQPLTEALQYMDVSIY